MRTTNPIAALLGKSPFKPMQAHMRIANECVSHVPALFEALIAGDQAEVIKVKDLIFAKEQEADDLNNELCIGRITAMRHSEKPVLRL